MADGRADWLNLSIRKSTQSGNACSLPTLLKNAAAEREASRNTSVSSGCEAHACLMQAALGLLEAEFEVRVVTDACSSRSERNRNAAFDRLAGNEAELVTTGMTAFVSLQTAGHPALKEMPVLLKAGNEIKT